MDSHNPKTEKVVTSETLRIETDHKDVRVLRSNIDDSSELAIIDDHDIGGDPYNSTGQHVVVSLKNRSYD